MIPPWQLVLYIANKYTFSTNVRYRMKLYKAQIMVYIVQGGVALA